MFNWSEICTKYRSYQLANDYGGMMAILNQIKSYYNLQTNAQALNLIRERCERFFPTFVWELPTSPEAEIDCYDCRAQIMQRYMAVEGCPSGWIASPVLAATGVSKNPCEKRNTTSSFGTSNFQPVNFYNKKTGKSYGDPVLMRGGGLSTAVNKKIGNTMNTIDARGFSRTRGVNTSMLSKGYPINTHGILTANAEHGFAQGGARAFVSNNGNGLPQNIEGRNIPHPLDANGARRVIGRLEYDVWTGAYKIDDGRPRGVIGGKVMCWGKCKKTAGGLIGRIFGGPGVVCPCRKKQGGACECNKCMGNQPC